MMVPEIEKTKLLNMSIDKIIYCFLGCKGSFLFVKVFGTFFPPIRSQLQNKGKFSEVDQHKFWV